MPETLRYLTELNVLYISEVQKSQEIVKRKKFSGDSKLYNLYTVFFNIFPELKF